MKTLLSQIIAVAIVATSLSGCATHITEVKTTDLGAPGARVGYVADGYCPSQATACEAFPLDRAAVDAFQKDKKLDYIVYEAIVVDDQVGANIGLFFAGAALGTPMHAGSRLQNIIGTYNHGQQKEFECDNRSQCRTEAARLIVNAQPAENGQQWPEETLTRLATAQKAAEEQRRANFYSSVTKDIEYQKMLISNLNTPGATPEAQRMKANAESKLRILEEARNKMGEQ